jgi:hypothetical protein
MITPNQLTQMTRLPLDHPKRRVYLVKKANKGSAIYRVTGFIKDLDRITIIDTEDRTLTQRMVDSHEICQINS